MQSQLAKDSRHILAVLRSTRCHGQCVWILDSDSATTVSCIEPFSSSSSSVCPWHLLGCFSKMKHRKQLHVEHSSAGCNLAARMRENSFVGWRLSFYKKSVVTSSDHPWMGTWAKIRNASRFWLEMQEPTVCHKPHPPAISSSWQLHHVHVEPLGVVPVDPRLSCWTLSVSKCNLGQPCIVKFSMESRP